MKAVGELFSGITLAAKPGEPYQTKNAWCDADEEHGAFVSKQWWGNGPWTGCPKCDKARQEAEDAERIQAEKEDRLRRFAQKMRDANVPRMFQNCTFDNFEVYGEHANEMQYALDFARNFAMNFEDMLRVGAFALFMGKTGTGKNHLACAIATHVMRMRYRALLTTQEGILNSITAGFGGGESRISVGHYIEPELLVIDEFGMGRETLFADSTIFSVIDGRYAEGRPTIFLTNLTRPQLENAVGDRVVSRLRDTARYSQIIPMAFEDYRIRCHNS